MTQLELAARPAAPTQPGGEFRSVIRSEVVATLVTHARGRAAAVTGERLAELVGLRLKEAGHEHALAISTLMRRVQEAVVQLIDLGEPVGSSSSPPAGYWWAETAEELEDGLRELEQRARMTLRRRRAMKGAIAKLQGQEALRGVA